MKDKLFETAIVTPLLAESNKILSGKFAELDKLNENGRNYPSPVYTSAYEAISPKIPQRRLMGELDHPLEYDEVRLTNVSHVVTECVIEGKEVRGKVELLDTPSGLVAQALVAAGIPLGISSRGLGATKKVREGVEVTKLKLITFDLVAQPSFSDAILLNESTYNELQESLNSIEETIPLNESVESQSIRDYIHQIRDNVKLNESVTTPEEDALKLFESEIASEDSSLESLNESLGLREAEVTHMTGLLEAKDVEMSIMSKTISSQQRIIENLKTRLVNSGVPGDEVKELVESIGSLTMELADAEERLASMEVNMGSLQESYNQLAEEKEQETSQLNESHTQLQESVKSTESLTSEIIELRKRLILESKGLSRSRHYALLEGCTTEREMEDKLKSLSHLSGASASRMDTQKLAETLTESQRMDLRSSRLANIVART